MRNVYKIGTRTYITNSEESESVDVKEEKKLIWHNTKGEELNVSIKDSYNIVIPKEESFKEKRNLKEVQLKGPNTCEHYKELGCVKDICSCYTLKHKQGTIEGAAENYENSFKESDGTESVDFIAGDKSDPAKDYWFKIFQEQDKNKYSEEDLEIAYFEGKEGLYSFKEWFEQFSKLKNEI